MRFLQPLSLLPNINSMNPITCSVNGCINRNSQELVPLLYKALCVGKTYSESVIKVQSDDGGAEDLHKGLWKGKGRGAFSKWVQEDSQRRGAML